MNTIFNDFCPLLLIAMIYFSLFLLLLIILNEALAACIFHFILFYFFHMISRFPWNIMEFVDCFCQSSFMCYVNNLQKTFTRK